MKTQRILDEIECIARKTLTVSLCATACFLLSAASHAQVLTSIANSVPAENVAIEIANSGSGLVDLQTRRTTTAENVTVAQSFQWNTPRKLDAIGIYLSPTQASWAWGSGDVQNYTLWISSGPNNTVNPATLIATYSFDVRGTQISNTGNKYYQISGLNLSLTQGQWYAFYLAPTPDGTPTSRRLFWQTSSTSYTGMPASINNATPYTLPMNDGGFLGRDLTCYLTAVPEGLTAATSIVSDIPVENVAINVANTGENVISVQTRNTALGLTDYTGIAQSFQWNSSQKLDGIGLYLNASQAGTGFGWNPEDVVNYTLHIHTGSGAGQTGTRTPIATYTFDILGSDIGNTGDKYVYISGLNLDLPQGQWYGFQLAPTPTGAPSARRLFWDSSNTTFAGNTQNFTTAIPYDGAYTNPFGTVKDFTFFMITQPSGNPYDDWAGGTFANAFPEGQRGAGVDFDSDGLSNLLEFVLGGDPTTNDSPSVRPSVIADGSNLVVTFKRSDASELAPAVSVKVQVSADLVTWNPADDILIGAATNPGPIGDANASYTVTNNAGLDTIVVTIPKGAATRKFARVVANKL